MSRTRRLALAALGAGAVTAVSFIAGATLIAASINSPAAAGGKGFGCGISAGQCSINQTDAFAFWFSGDPTNPGPQVSIDALRSNFVMRPRGGPATITPVETVVNIQIFTGTGPGAFGCFVIPDSQFAVSQDLQSATLNATLTAGETCPGFMTPLLGAIQAAPLAGGGGPPGGGLSLPLTVNVTWTGPGAAFKSTSSSTQTCAGFTSSFHSQGASSQAKANGNTLVFGDGSTLALGSTSSAGVDDFNSIITSNGFPGPECLGS
ncbi:MAG TPA: hypothetical protein VKF16_08765 [Candidatus Dormibacteraeota bacterium]|nr:hypothetical protein [Candidatus Dormibacteraeota bacterium]